MKRIAFFLLFVLWSGSSFAQRDEKLQPKKVETATDSMVRQATSDHFVIIAGESSDYIWLKQVVQDLSTKSRILYNDEGLIFDRKLGLIWPPDTSGNADLYAGSYFMRRYGTMLDSVNYLSLEMRDWYFNVPYEQKSLRMIIVGGIYPDTEKKAADERLKEIKKYYPTAYLRKLPIYMGCIH